MAEWICLGLTPALASKARDISRFFYWDTAFTNTGLLRLGLVELAKNNLQNILWLIDRQGFMPNHVGLSNRSQPPYLCRMVREYLVAVGGPQTEPGFFERCAEAVRKEYQFWLTARNSPTGLARYGHQATAEEAAAFYDEWLPRRLGKPADASSKLKSIVGGHYLAEAETGWDFNPRFDGRCMDFNAVELNGLLYGYETWLGQISGLLGWGDEALWRNRIAARQQLAQDLLWDEPRGWFLDYDFVNKTRSGVLSLAAMNMLLSGLASDQQAERIHENLGMLEREHGVAVTEQRPGAHPHQWGFPNCWPPLVYVTVEGLRRYGYDDAAQRIAEKFVNTTRRLFSETGQLWEKTDAVTGGVAGGEYQAAPMIGWTAGVYLHCIGWLDS